MDVRDKLLELLESEEHARRLYPDLWVDKLIANGVTIPVHCEECVHCVKGEPYDPWECMKWTTKFGVAYATEGGFCHRGERKE